MQHLASLIAICVQTLEAININWLAIYLKLEMTFWGSNLGSRCETKARRSGLYY